MNRLNGGIQDELDHNKAIFTAAEIHDERLHVMKSKGEQVKDLQAKIFELT